MHPIRTLALIVALCISQPVLAQLPIPPSDREVLRRPPPAPAPHPHPVLGRVEVLRDDDITIVKRNLGAGIWTCTVWYRETILIWGVKFRPATKQKTTVFGPAS